MNKEQLQNEEKKIEEELDRIAKSENALGDPIYDGVVDVDRYLASSPRILWILKEPWDDPDNGGWSLTKDLLAKGWSKDKGAPTMISIITWSVFNGFPSVIPWPSQDPRIGDSLKNIAVINVSKYPGESTSSPVLIAEAYQKNKGILLRQIDVLDPEVIIGGNTLHLFFDALQLSEEMFTCANSASFCKKEGRLFIRAYHPAQRNTVDREDYGNDIIGIIKANYRKSGESGSTLET